MKIGQLETGIKPQKHHWRKKYPYGDMEVGQSVVITGSKEERERACSVAHSYGYRNNKKFTCRTKNGEMRVHRLS